MKKSDTKRETWTGVVLSAVDDANAVWPAADEPRDARPRRALRRQPHVDGAGRAALATAAGLRRPAPPAVGLHPGLDRSFTRHLLHQVRFDPGEFQNPLQYSRIRLYHPAAYIGHFRPEPNCYIIKTLWIYHPALRLYRPLEEVREGTFARLEPHKLP